MFFKKATKVSNNSYLHYQTVYRFRVATVETVCTMLPGGVCAKGCSIFSFFKCTLT